MNMPDVALAVTDGLPLLEIAAPCDIFGVDRSDLASPWYSFAVCATGAARVGGWFHSDTPYGLDQLAAAETVIIPACHNIHEKPPADLVAAVSAAHKNGARVASICTGAFVLAAAGLLDGRRATTHWMHAGLLAERHPRVQVDPNVLYIDEGAVLTSAGKAAALDLCLHIVRTDHGTAVANALARRLVVPPHRPGGQAQFIATPLPNSEHRGLADLLDWTLARLDQPLSVNDMAQQACMSTRNLARRFNAITGTTPLQ